MEVEVFQEDGAMRCMFQGITIQQVIDSLL